MNMLKLTILSFLIMNGSSVAAGNFFLNNYSITSVDIHYDWNDLDGCIEQIKYCQKNHEEETVEKQDEKSERSALVAQLTSLVNQRSTGSLVGSYVSEWYKKANLEWLRVVKSLFSSIDFENFELAQIDNEMEEGLRGYLIKYKAELFGSLLDVPFFELEMHGFLPEFLAVSPIALFQTGSHMDLHDYLPSLRSFKIIEPSPEEKIDALGEFVEAKARIRLLTQPPYEEDANDAVENMQDSIVQAMVQDLYRAPHFPHEELEHLNDDDYDTVIMSMLANLAYPASLIKLGDGPFLQQIKSLDLSQSGLSTVGLMMLTENEAWQNMFEQLEELDLSDIPRLNVDALLQFINAVNLSALKVLKLSRLGLTNEEVSILLQRLQELGVSLSQVKLSQPEGSIGLTLDLLKSFISLDSDFWQKNGIADQIAQYDAALKEKFPPVHLQDLANSIIDEASRVLFLKDLTAKFPKTYFYFTDQD